MPDSVVDFYTGFEGEPEIQFSTASGCGGNRIVRVWVGYFDAIMSKVKPGPTGWTGLALPYHLNAGWYDSSPWRIPDLDAVVKQWGSIETASLSPDSVRAHSAVLELLRHALATSQPVTISYE